MNMGKIINNIYDNVTNKVDDKLFSYISRFIDPSMSKLEKSIVIYLCLGDVLYYNPEFSLTYDRRKVREVGDINLDNNDIICKNWSVLYKRLLSKYNIFSKISKKRGHYKVEIPLDGVIYSADGTGYGSFGIHYSMSDIARIKCNFMIEKFRVEAPIDPNDSEIVLRKDKELKSTLKSIYDKQNRKYYTNEQIGIFTGKIFNAINANVLKYGLGSEEDILYRIKIINRFWGLNIITCPLERVQLFNNFFKNLFIDYDEYNAKCYNIYSYNNGCFRIYKLIAIEVEECFYYFFDCGNCFKRFTVSELKEEFYNRNVRISEYMEILGIYTGLERFRIRQ